MISFMLEASHRQRHEDRDRSGRWGEQSSSRSSGRGHGSLAARIEGMSGSGNARSLQTHIEGSAGAPVRSSHRAWAEGSRPSNPYAPTLFRIPIPDQTPPSGSSKYMTDQENFCLQHIVGASRSEGSHTFIRPDTKWDGNAAKLWLNPLSWKSWYWNNRCQPQMAREAAEIPFDQRSLAQRWAVREATIGEVLPEGFCSVELDIETMGQWRLIPRYIQCKTDGHMSAKDWTAWLFLAMTQPDQEPAVIDWFWWMACRIFVEEGTFNKAMAERPLPSLEGIPYIPQRLITPAIGFDTNNLVEHFIKCGLRPQDVETLFKDFASLYLAQAPQPYKPDWSRVLPSPMLTSRGTIKERVKLRKKEMKSTHTELEAQAGSRAREIAPIQITNTQAVSLPPPVSQARPTSPDPEPGDVSMGSDAPAE